MNRKNLKSLAAILFAGTALIGLTSCSAKEPDGDYSMVWPTTATVHVHLDRDNTNEEMDAHGKIWHGDGGATSDTRLKVVDYEAIKTDYDTNWYACTDLRVYTYSENAGEWIDLSYHRKDKNGNPLLYRGEATKNGKKIRIKGYVYSK